MGISLYPKGNCNLIKLPNTVYYPDPDNAVLRNLTHDAIELSETNTSILNRAYPIGSIYMSIFHTDPSLLFNGGIWERITGTFLLCENPGYASVKNGATGGEAAHTITAAEMPKHNHDTPFFKNPDTGIKKGVYGRGQTVKQALADTGQTSTKEIWWDNAGNGVTTEMRTAEGNEFSYLTSYKGSGVPYNHMPPYLCVYMWKRIA